MYTGAASTTHGCSLYHIRLQGHASHGVLVEAGGGGRLSANRILRGGVGVRLADNAKGFVKENEIEGCAGAGLDVSTGAEPEAASNAL